MKKVVIALMCVAGVALVVACGGKKNAEAEAEQENVEATAEEVAAEESEQAVPGEGKAELKLTVDSVIPEAMKAIYANGDFKPCPAVFFRDDLSGEKVGEFPSKWDVSNGSAEVAKFNDRLVINLSNNDARITPKVAGDSKDYLPEVFTIEFEFFCNGDEDFNASYRMLFSGVNEDLGEIVLNTEENIHWELTKQNDEQLSGDDSKLATIVKKNSWNHFAISYDKGTMKLYVNGTRIVSLPNIKAPGCFVIGGEGWDDHRYYFTNVRMGTIVKE